MNDPRRPGKTEAILSLIGMLISVWLVMPPEERFWLKRQATHRLYLLTAQAARKAGHRGMGDELADRDFQRYDLAYLLSRARDDLAAKLEDMRP